MTIDQAKLEYKKALIKELVDLAENYGESFYDDTNRKGLFWKFLDKDWPHPIHYDGVDNFGRVKNFEMNSEYPVSWDRLELLGIEQLSKLHDHVTNKVMKKAMETFRNRELINQTMNILSTSKILSEEKLNWVREKLSSNTNC